ncbi:MAG: hypothetical protein QUU85_04000 [Candidatus Eisenbacteria bacterium]|nr:hypothetical protein [Candidatus Eisenbacteria bacterium]
MSRTILLAVVVLLCAASRGADAGRNNNGALIVHTNDAAVYSADDDYCGTVFDEHAPADCAAAITRTDKGEEEIAVIWFLAAFTEHHHPQINAIQFGVDHNLPADAGQVSAWGACGPTPQEIPEEGWPAVPSGNIVGFGEPITDLSLIHI